MKKQELVSAYLKGRIDRRRFVRGLVAAGVTATAAVTYADVLAAGASGPVPRNVALSVYPTTGSTADALPVKIGQVNVNNNPGGPTVIQGSTAPTGGFPPRVAMIWGDQQAAHQFGVQGSASAAGSPTTAAGIGVVATSTNGASLVLTDDGVLIPPLGGGLTTFWDTGAFVVTGGNLWYCLASGVGSASQWVKLSSPLTVLPSPFRVYDSRSGQPNPSGSPQGMLAFGQTRTINCTPSLPVGVTASALLMNLTVSGTVGANGALTVFSAAVAVPSASSINWTSAGTNLANAVTSACDNSQDIKVKCVAKAGCSTNFIIDVIGFYA